jgi:hypothetical protein
MVASRAHRRQAPALGAITALLVAALPAAASTTPPLAADDPTAAQSTLRCEPPMLLGRDRLTVVCALDPTAAPLRVRVKVYFTGSHDDTTASMDVALGDAPVACDAGSKTSTESEDGDVTLECRFTAIGKAAAPSLLRASARWFHAQYVNLEVTAGLVQAAQPPASSRPLAAR